MKSLASAMSGRAARDLFDEPQVVAARVAAVHGGEDAVGSRLHRQVQVGHQRGEVAMRRDQRVVHVTRMAGGVAQAIDARNFGEPEQQFAEAPDATVGALAVPGVDVLAEQGQLAHAGVRQSCGLRDDRRHRARYFRSASVGDDAEGAELVATLLHGEEGGGRGLCPGRAGGPPRLLACCPAAANFSATANSVSIAGRPGRTSAIIAGRRWYDWGPTTISTLLAAAHDLRPFGLRHAAGDAEQHGAAPGSGGLLQLIHATELGIDLLGGLLADVAGVEENEIGALGGAHGSVAGSGQRVRHPLGIVDVHLAAVRPDEDFLQFLARSGHPMRQRPRPSPPAKSVAQPLASFAGG